MHYAFHIPEIRQLIFDLILHDADNSIKRKHVNLVDLSVSACGHRGLTQEALEAFSKFGYLASLQVSNSLQPSD